MALCLIRFLNYLNEEEAKHLTTLESLVDRRREDLARLPGPSRTQAKPDPGQAGPRGQLPGREVLESFSELREEQALSQSGPAARRDEFRSSWSPSHSVWLVAKTRKQKDWVLTSRPQPRRSTAGFWALAPASGLWGCGCRRHKVMEPMRGQCVKVLCKFINLGINRRWVSYLFLLS